MDEGLKYIGKGIVAIAAAAVCGYMLYLTEGKHGIGWFIAAIVCIW